MCEGEGNGVFVLSVEPIYVVLPRGACLRVKQTYDQIGINQLIAISTPPSHIVLNASCF